MSALTSALHNNFFHLKLTRPSHFMTFICVGLLFLAPLFANTATTERGEIHGTPEFNIPSWFKNSFLEIADDAAEAADNNKHALLFFHLNNCPYCSRMLEENFITGPNASFVQEHFDSIELNIKGDREVVFDAQTTLSEKDLASALNVMYTPAMLFIDADNNPVLRLDGYRDQARFKTALEFVHSKAYLNSTLQEYAATHAAPINKYRFREHPAFTSASDLQALAQEPLAILFEDENCSNCDEVHDNLFARADVKEALSNIKVVRLDALSDAPLTDPSGNRTTAKAMAAKNNLTYRPAVLLYDQGREIMRIDSRLYAWYFNGFVNWVAGRHYQQQPQVFAWLRELREQYLDSGIDVNYAD